MKLLYPVLFCACMTAAGLNAQNALSFDGVDDRVDCGDDTSIQITGSTLTLEAWIYPTTWKANAYDGNVIVKENNSNNNGYMLRVGNGGRLNFAIGSGKWQEITTQALLSLNTWQHIAGTYDGQKMRVYINGAAVDSMAVAISIGNATPTILTVGGHPTYTRFFEGLIDEARIWRVTRSEAQLNAQMYDEFCSSQKGLKAYYKFNQGKAGLANPTVKTLTDYSGYNNKGTLSGFGLTGSISNWVKGYAMKRAISTGSDVISRCNTYTSPSNKYKWTVSGTYHDTIQTAWGCDSAITLYVTIKKSTARTISAFACKSYTGPSGNYTWTQSGTYTDYLTNAAKCDSVITILLKIGADRDTLHPEVCKTYTSPSGRYTWSQPGWYSDTLLSYRGCDSVIAIDLEILKPGIHQYAVSDCRSHTSPSGKHVWTATGQYTDTLVNYRGCDSLIYVTLKILSTSKTISRTVCNTYTSPSGNHTWTNSGIYKDTLLNNQFCDSLLTINLTVNKTTTSSFSATSCRSYIAPGKKKIWRASGLFRDTLVGSKGCDSVITVNLTINNPNKAVIQAGEVLTAQSSGGTFQWMNCVTHTKIPGATAKVYTATTNGKYEVEVLENNCKDTSACFTVSGLSTASVPGLEFALFPNPNTGTFRVVLPGTFAHAKVIVRDVSGRQVLEADLASLQNGLVSMQQAPGIYLVEVQADGLRAVQQLMIE